MAGTGGFNVLGPDILESFGGIGLLWYTAQQFGDFTLKVDWRASGPTDNSGVFLRFPALGNSDPANDWKLAVNQGYEIQIDDTGYNPDTYLMTEVLPLCVLPNSQKVGTGRRCRSCSRCSWSCASRCAREKSRFTFPNMKRPPPAAPKPSFHCTGREGARWPSSAPAPPGCAP
jgi:hypothetical protein